MNKNSIAGCTYFFHWKSKHLVSRKPPTQIRTSYWTLPYVKIPKYPIFYQGNLKSACIFEHLNGMITPFSEPFHTRYTLISGV